MNGAVTDEKIPKKRGGCLRRLARLALVGLVLLAVFCVWLNGPGFRWLGPKVVGHYLEKAGFEGSLRLEGTLLGGVEVYDLDLRSRGGALERLVVDRLVTDYRFSEVIRGKVRGISGGGIRAEIRVVEKEREDKPPVDFVALSKTLGALRERILPLNLDLERVSLSVKKDGVRVVELEDSDFSHIAGEEVVELELGRIIDPEGRFTQKQKAALVWEEGQLTLDNLDLLPSIGLRDVAVMLPEDGMVSAESMIRLGGAMLRLDVGKGLRDVRLDLIEGEFDFGKTLGGFGVVIPLKGRLTSLAVEVKQVFPEWQAAVGTVEAFMEDFSYAGWEVPELAAGVTLDEGAISAKLAGKSLGSDVTVNGAGNFERAKLGTGDFLLRRISGDLAIARVDEVLRALDVKLDLGPDFSGFPESDISGSWAVDLGEGGFGGVDGDLLLKAKAVDATPVRLNARYDHREKVVTVREFVADGMVFSGMYGIESQEYEAKQVLKDFDSGRIVPWLRGAGIETPGSSVVSMQWAGGGNFAARRLSGVITGLDGVWQWNAPQEGVAREPVAMKAEKLVYNWPGSARVDGLVVETEGQVLKLDAGLAANELTLDGFTWLDGGQELAKGKGKLPVPEDFSNWKAFLESDTRPLDLTIQSETLPLAKLRPWVKGLEQIDDKATGKVDLKIAGSLAVPEVDAVVEIRQVSVPGRSEVPMTDVTLSLKARDGGAEISAEALATGYAPATLKAEMAFLPRKWAQDTGSLMAEKIAGTLDLPRVELSRFQPLIPGAEELGGVAEGKVVIAGTVAAPSLNGNLKLSGGKLRMKGRAIPAMDGIALEVDADLETIKFKGGVANMAGGDLTLAGSLELKNEAGDGLGALDVSLKGTGLPVLRNEFLIVRASADLKIAGRISDAKLTGEIGIIDSVFFKDMDLIPIGKPFVGPSAASLPKVDTPANPGAKLPAPLDAWTLDVVVKTIDPILIRGNLGTGQVDVALRLEGNLGDPKPNGKARVTDLVARLPFSTLQVNEGFLNFTPQTGFDPVLEIRGTSEPRPYRVQVYAYGRASDPQLVLTSQPPLPENEIMTLLATGTTSAGLEDSQAASSRAMQLLIEEMRRGRFLFGKQLRPVLGLLDNVDFSLSEADPYDSDTYSSATLELSDKFFISAGLGATGDQRVMAIWRLRFR
jgi:TamB, inner membrane protein subunit of TAM complex